MKLLPRCLILLLATALLSGLLPKPGYCAMPRKARVSCAARCCKPSTPKPACPMYRQAPRLDVIAPTAVSLSADLHVVQFLSFREFVVATTGTARWEPETPVPKPDFCSTPQSIPAPPVLA